MLRVAEMVLYVALYYNVRKTVCYSRQYEVKRVVD